MDLCKIYKLRRYYLQNTKRPKRCPAHVNITGTEQVNICFLIVSVTEQHLTHQIFLRNLTKMVGACSMDGSMTHPLLVKLLCEFLYVLNEFVK